MPRLSDSRVLAPSHTALALELVTDMDLLRLKAIARLYARGLPPDVAWDDLLQEAMVWGRSRAHATSPTQSIVADSIYVIMPAQHVRELHALRGAVHALHLMACAVAYARTSGHTRASVLRSSISSTRCGWRPWRTRLSRHARVSS